MKMRRLRRRLSPRRNAVLISPFFLCLFFTPYPAPAQNADTAEAAPAPTLSSALMQYKNRSDDELLIVSLDLGGLRLMDALLLYEDLDSGQYYVPLNDFLDALEFPIDVNPDSTRAQGWFIQESRQFDLDLAAGQIVIDGKTQSLDAKDIERHKDGIYVSLEQLQKWFPITTEIDYNNLILMVKSLEPLPVEIKRERDKLHKSLQAREENEDNKIQNPLDEIKAPLFTIPYIDTNTQMAYDTSQSAINTMQTSYTSLASGIVLGQDTDFRINDTFHDGQKSDIRLTMGRKDPQNDLLGLGLSEYSLGDVNTNSIPLISRGVAGRGVSVSNMPLNLGSSVQSNKITLRGELPVGYQADIAQNGQLIGFVEEPDSNGEYVFEVNVLPGLNVFELSLYGPQGQKDVREERIYVPANIAKKGSFGFKTSVIQDSTNLFTNRISRDDDVGEARLLSEVTYGLSDRSSLYGAAASLSMDGKRQNYGLMRYSRSFKGVKADLTYARNAQRGQTAALAFQGVFRGLRWQVEHAHLDKFISEETAQANLSGILVNTSKMRFSGILPLFQNIPFSLNLDRVQNKAGEQRVNIQARLTKNLKKLRLTPQLSQKIQTGQDRETDLSLQVSSRYQKVTLRGVLAYSVEPVSVLNNISLNADWHYNQRTTFHAGLHRTGGNAPVHTLNLGASQDLKSMKLGLNFSYNNNQEFLALLSSSFALGYDPIRSSAFITEDKFTAQGVFIPQVFYDKNNNQRMDMDEDYIENVSFLGEGIDKKATTNNRGYTFLTAPSYERSSVRVNPSSLDDPYLVSLTPPKDYILRPGQNVKKDFPIIMVGEADAQIYKFRQGEKVNAPSILLDVIAQDGAVISQAKSEYDGFILLQNIPIGEYTVQINPQQLEELGYCAAPPQSLLLDAQDPFISLSDITLWPKVTNPQSVNIILEQSSTEEQARETWDALRLVLENISWSESFAPVAYIFPRETEHQDTLYDLALYDVSPVDTDLVCAALEAQGVECHVRNNENLCPSSIIALNQIATPAQAGMSSISNTYFTEDFNEDSLMDLDTEQIEKLIDN